MMLAPYGGDGTARGKSVRHGDIKKTGLVAKLPVRQAQLVEILEQSHGTSATRSSHQCPAMDENAGTRSSALLGNLTSSPVVTLPTVAYPVRLGSHTLASVRRYA